MSRLSRQNRRGRPEKPRVGGSRGTKGAVYVEFLIVFWPIFLTFWVLTQAAGLYSAKLIVMHSAVTGARAAAVVIPDDPKNYGGEEMNKLTSKRRQAIERAVAIPQLASLSLGMSEVEFPNGTSYGPGSTVVVHVKTPYYCELPIAKWFVCIAGTRILEGRASMPVHAATYEYPE
ncbi:MAG: hypothetical protein KC776_14105 [Myxococcales bacterium]|nr:hypothetical protein [Myxococcales bacterium]MCB9579784.1 hypothetical protein [Polyangiaceae bacterium]